ncbi:MAG: cation transporter [Betaproteobacteria bacterium]|nr:cation diffusion facilitator family transporter [Betaproteobacteria bacterium]MBU6512544.1 cation diffusion facilitator family transporter [Betaproteobacteria bacterium]MDE1955744.1 cation transporter [Betaproteobacteria bacterium]MDE2153313.1 cation transporter [Betaproteobacteria bacterium]MDE2479089.1 cation transporter [Betaproteobacteria bacterium]
MRRYLYVSLAAAFGVIALKLGAWRLTGSVGFLSDALESLVNVVAAGFALLMVAIAGRPPDTDHPYGHTKAEYFSSALEGLLIGVAALGIAAEAVRRLLAPHPVHMVAAGAVLNVAATLINLAVARWMLGGAQRLRSIVLEADARHLLADVWTSVGVVVGVALVPLTGWLWLDPVVGIVVAGHIVGEAWRLVARSVDGLMDRSLPDSDLAEVEKVLRQFRCEDLRFDHVRTRRAGTRRFVGMHMHMPAQWSLGRAADCRLQVERALTQRIAGLVVTIEMLPQGQESLQDGGPGDGS